MAIQGAIQTITPSTNSESSLKKLDEKTAYTVIPPAITVSMSTAWYRRTGNPRACSVTPDEYRSRLLMENNWTMATIRNGIRNQPLNAAGKPRKGSAGLMLTYVATQRPRSMITTCGTAVPTN